MDFSFYRVFIIAGILGVQFFFSTRTKAYWGAILPVAYVVFLTWMFVTNQIDSMLGYILYLLLGLAFLLAQWSGGRRYLHEKQQKELEKMKKKDMK